jgi:hypothetical protein
MGDLKTIQKNMGWIDLYSLSETTVKKSLQRLDEDVKRAKDDFQRQSFVKQKLKDEENLRFIEALKGHKKYSSAVSGYTAPRSKKWDDKARENETWRRKSKGGLYYACKVAHKTVHFCLDGLGDFKTTIGKSYAGKAGDDGIEGPEGTTWAVPPDRAQNESDRKFRVVTGAELRWVYRNREDADVQKHIQFWLANKPSVPPWDPGYTGRVADWSQYTPREKKDIHNDSLVVEEVEQDVLEESPSVKAELNRVHTSINQNLAKIDQSVGDSSASSATPARPQPQVVAKKSTPPPIPPKPIRKANTGVSVKQLMSMFQNG